MEWRRILWHAEELQAAWDAEVKAIGGRRSMTADDQGVSESSGG